MSKLYECIVCHNRSFDKDYFIQIVDGDGFNAFACAGKCRNKPAEQTIQDAITECVESIRSLNERVKELENKNNASEILKPCPFCGSRIRIISFSDLIDATVKYKFGCCSCGFEREIDGATGQSCVAQMNRRANK